MHIIPCIGDCGSLNFKVMIANKWLHGRLFFKITIYWKLFLYSGDLLLENVKFRLHLMEEPHGKSNFPWEIVNGILLPI